MTAPTRQFIDAMYAAFAKGRVDAVLDGVTDDIDFVCYAPVEMFPWLGRKRGKAAFGETLRAVHAHFEILSYQPVSVVAQGDDASVLILCRMKQRESGRIMQFMVADYLRFRDGRIAEMREFTDSFDLVQQMIGREIDLSKV